MVNYQQKCHKCGEWFRPKYARNTFEDYQLTTCPDCKKKESKLQVNNPDGFNKVKRNPKPKEEVIVKVEDKPVEVLTPQMIRDRAIEMYQLSRKVYSLLLSLRQRHSELMSKLENPNEVKYESLSDEKVMEVARKLLEVKV